jgi:hypothetical protein
MRMMKEPGLYLQAALGLAAVGMALIVFGVVHSALFFPGLFVLTAGLIGAAAAGVLFLFRRGES